jgi:hypothetical protein
MLQKEWHNGFELLDCVASGEGIALADYTSGGSGQAGTYDENITASQLSAGRALFEHDAPVLDLT